MSRFLVIGYGSTLRGDDAAGRHVADRLAQALDSFSEPSSGGSSLLVEVLSVPQLTYELALQVAEAEQVYFIDASCVDGEPGRWACQRLRAFAETPADHGGIRRPAAATGSHRGQEVASTFSAHRFDPAALLGVTRALFQVEPTALIITIAGKSFELGETLTPEVESAVGEVAEFLLSSLAMSNSLKKGIAKAGIHGAQKHLFVCLGPDCCDLKREGEPLWKHIKEALRDLPIPVMRTKAECFRICSEGPLMVIYPDGIWYRNVSPERFDRILREHILEGRPVREWVIAENALGCHGGCSGQKL